MGERAVLTVRRSRLSRIDTRTSGWRFALVADGLSTEGSDLTIERGLPLAAGLAEVLAEDEGRAVSRRSLINELGERSVRVEVVSRCWRLISRGRDVPCADSRCSMRSGAQGDGVRGDARATVVEVDRARGGKRSARFRQAERGAASPGGVAPRMSEAAAWAAEFGAPRRRARAKGSLSAGQAAGV
jgi:hypothetical protein